MESSNQSSQARSGLRAAHEIMPEVLARYGLSLEDEQGELEPPLAVFCEEESELSSVTSLVAS